ncbi:MAG TPA: DinB family protein [Ohtaekwangia sp.]|nr:DinB family protein [Ohtaekwangia sp.]
MTITPDLNSVPPFYKGYVENVKSFDLHEALRHAGQTTVALVRTIPEPKGDFRYEPGKWTIRELLCHMMDAERIFAYRALRFARNDTTPLSGFEENDYATEANAEGRTIARIADEMEHLRTTSIDLFLSFTQEMLRRTGTANKTELSVVNLGFIIAGHELHHRKILVERYLKS